MTPPMPPGLVRSPAVHGPTLLQRWKDAEPVRLYAYTVLGALVLVLAGVGVVTEDLSAALTGLAAAVLGIPAAAEAGRASVLSPATARARRQDDAARWVALTARQDAAA